MLPAEIKPKSPFDRTTTPKPMSPPAIPARLASLRSFLFAPASHRGRAERAISSTAHAAILDLEDAVAGREKPQAREIAESLLSPRRGSQKAAGPARLLRINAADTPFFADDLALLERVDIDALVLPKAGVEALERLPDPPPPVYALIESAAGLREAFALASSPCVAGLMLGAVDLAADMGLGRRPDGIELLFARSQLVRDSRAAGALPPVDGVWTQLDDPAGLMREATLARALGLRGKLCIHPRQLDAVHAAFAPDEQEQAWAQRVLQAYNRALSNREGAVSMDGELVDLAVVERARRLLGEAVAR
jgi:citrate lyase subunit beta/citryl-CoA lyase